MVFDGNAIFGFYLDRRLAERLFGGPARFWRRPLLWNASALTHNFSIGRVLLRVVSNFDKPRRVAGLLVGFRNDERHRLHVEVDPVRLKRAERLVLLLDGARRRLLVRSLRPKLWRIQVSEDANHPRRTFRLARVDRFNCAFGY